MSLMLCLRTRPASHRGPTKDFRGLLHSFRTRTTNTYCGRVDQTPTFFNLFARFVHDDHHHQSSSTNRAKRSKKSHRGSELERFCQSGDTLLSGHSTSRSYVSLHLTVAAAKCIDFSNHCIFEEVAVFLEQRLELLFRGVLGDASEKVELF